MKKLMFRIGNKTLSLERRLVEGSCNWDWLKPSNDTTHYKSWPYEYVLLYGMGIYLLQYQVYLVTYEPSDN